ncbi:MAG TPA: hypothetical protein VJ728_05780 [Candidatus Binataceae bacterium]|nr:hypothetical protein [Candidatus Binataceae bacterium]
MLQAAEGGKELMKDNKSTRLLRLVDELSDAAKRLGLEVRREKILREIGYRARGGACRFRDRTMIILDREMAPAEQVEILADALRGHDLEALYLSPAARRLVDAAAEPGS